MPHRETPIESISPATLRDWLGDGQELALIDVRDGGPFSRAHLLVASNIPLAQMEIRAPLVLPRRSARIALMDDGEGYAAKAAALLQVNGYSNVSVVAGDIEASRLAGFEIFSGTNVPSKAFGEIVEHHYDTPRIDPQILKQWQDEGRDIVVVDSRPLEEYRMVSIPGAADCPGAELVLRVPALLRSPNTTVVVNCAGRTRSIIGCQSLRNAGLPNPVFALKNGTMGWELAGMKAARGHDNILVEPGPPALQSAKAMAAEVAKRFGVRFIDDRELAVMQAETDRTTYLFDVRLPDAFAASHRRGSLSAPGGQLVQATDTFAAIRNARIVLIDQHEVQAVMTAHWLLQMGWRDVFVLRGGLAGALEAGPVVLAPLASERSTVKRIAPAALKAKLDADAVEIIDVGESYTFRQSHIPGSKYAMRSRLGEALRSIDPKRTLVFACADGRLAPFAASDAAALGRNDVLALEGGRAAWRAAGFPTAQAGNKNDERFLTETDDMWYPPWARQSGVEEAMKQYLTWEVNLLEQIERETYFSFGTLPQ